MRFCSHIPYRNTSGANCSKNFFVFFLKICTNFLQSGISGPKYIIGNKFFKTIKGLAQIVSIYKVKDKKEHFLIHRNNRGNICIRLSVVTPYGALHTNLTKGGTTYAKKILGNT